MMVDLPPRGWGARRAQGIQYPTGYEIVKEKDK